VSRALLEVDGLVVSYPLPRTRLFGPAPHLRVLHGVGLEVAPGESFGLVGESGSGKSTLARAVLALERPDAGSVRLLGRDLLRLAPAELRAMRRHVQMVFQDPYGSLDPRHAVLRIVAEPLQALLPPESPRVTRARVVEALEAVGLDSAALGRFPHEFSGGQRQRIAIARALVTEPDLIVADEPVSSLDVSVQAQVLNLMRDLQEEKGLAFLFIGHDLSVVRHVASRVGVMYLGRIVEEGPTAEVFARPLHPYTKALVAAVPRAEPWLRHRTLAAGEAPAVAAEAGAGCPFAPRCREAVARCREELPLLRALASGRRAACHLD
jgi:peptide/nickel transport system ATP-binding protein